MWPKLVRRVFFPAHEWLLGRPTRECVRALEASQWFSPAEIRALQARKLADLLLHAYRHVPYYRRVFESAGIDRATWESLKKDRQFNTSQVHGPRVSELLRSLPLLDKRIVREQTSAMVWPDAPGGLFPHNTGGSTGEPLQFFVDRRRQAYDQAARIRTHRWFGVDFGEREILLWGSPIEIHGTDRLKRFRDTCFNQRLLDAFNMSPRRMDQYLDVLSRYRPASLFGYPSSLSLLADHAEVHGRAVDTSCMKAVFVTGEVCFPTQKETLERYFGVPVANGYGSRDAGFIAHECPQGRMHVTAENLYLEVLRDGKPVGDGEIGELVVTHLDAYAMPFIRYRTGDMGRLLDGRCSCGRGLPLMDVVAGRQTDFLHLPDGTVKHALSVIYPLRELAGIRQFQVVQAGDYSVRIKVRPASAGAVKAAEVRRAVLPVLESVPSIGVELVEEIPVSASGKFQYVRSEVQSPVMAEAKGHG